MMDLASWLTRLGLDKYIGAFIANEIDLVALRYLQDEDLKELGLPIGPRRKILAAIDLLADDARSPTKLEPRAAERRQLTVMFVDLVGSTELSQRLDPEEMHTVLRAYQSAVSMEIARYEGSVAKLMGDGILAYFGWPEAHEDDAERAVRAGLAAAAVTSCLTTPLGDELSARIGIATGLVMVGDLIGTGSAQEEAVVGDTPNLAARLQALAEPNAVVIGASTHRLVAELFEMTHLGLQQIKGYATPIPAWRVCGEADTEGRFEALHRTVTPLVGRTEELEILLQCWQRARTGKGQVVMLSGEAGIGKSRLTAGLEERLYAEPHARLRYFCSPYHANSPLYPVTRQLERAARFGKFDDAGAKLDKLETLLLRAMPNIDETSPLIASLLSIDTADRYAPTKLTPQALKRETLHALIAQIEGIASNEGVVAIVEDAHWIDPTTSEWLDMLIERLRELPVLLVVTYRPEFQPHWLELPQVTTISLGRLTKAEGASIIDRVAGDRHLPTQVRHQILAKTEGVPLFVEELTSTVLESESDFTAASTIPSTLQDSLMARLDRLGSVKAVAQVGACIGRHFQHTLLAAATRTNAAILAIQLNKLEESGLVSRTGDAKEATYTFKHALVRDAAYQSLLRSRRQQIHATIGAALEAQFPEVVETEPETVAYHCSQGGMAYRAGSYWLRAGQLALKRSANIEALAHLKEGLESIANLSSTDDRLRLELQLQNAFGVAAMAVKGWGAPDVFNAFSSARRLSEKLNDTGELFVAVRGEASYHMISGHLREADALGRRCLHIAKASNDLGMRLEAHHHLWATKFFMGDYLAGQKHATCGMAIYDPARDHQLTYIYTGHDPGVCCRNFSAMMLCIVGYPDAAVARCREAMALAEREAHSVTMATAHATLAIVHLMLRQPERCLESAERQLDICTKFALPLLASSARFYIGWALSQLGQPDKGIENMHRGVADIAATGADMGMNFYLALLGQACAAHGDADEGMALTEKALGILTKSGSRYQLPEVLRIKGELLARLNGHEAIAENLYRKSLAMAHCDGAKSTELRGAMSLARLFIAQGRDEEAHGVLAPVYASFTEGFDFADLIEARQLLDHLGNP